MPLKRGTEHSTEDRSLSIENCLSPAFETTKRQRVSYGLRGIKLLHYNAETHTDFNVRKFIESNFVIEIDHQAYSPDLAPCDYRLFDYIKQRLGDGYFLICLYEPQN